MTYISGKTSYKVFYFFCRRARVIIWNLKVSGNSTETSGGQLVRVPKVSSSYATLSGCVRRKRSAKKINIFKPVVRLYIWKTRKERLNIYGRDRSSGLTRRSTRIEYTRQVRGSTIEINNEYTRRVSQIGNKSYSSFFFFKIKADKLAEEKVIATNSDRPLRGDIGSEWRGIIFKKNPRTIRVLPDTRIITSINLLSIIKR